MPFSVIWNPPMITCKIMNASQNAFPTDPKERSDPTFFSGAYPLFHWKDVVAGIERYLMQDESDTAGRYLTTVCRIVPIGKQRTGL